MENVVAHQRSSTPDIIKRLFSKPYTIKFQQAVRLLQKMVPNGEKLGETYLPSEDPITFSSRHSYSLPTSDIYSITWKNHVPCVEVNFFGLGSPNGPLPAPLSELIHDHLYDKKYALQAFLDIFNNRLLALRCLIAQKYSFVLSPSNLIDSTAGNVLSALAGLESNDKDFKTLHQNLLKYAGLLWQRPRSACGLEQLLENYFQIPVTVEQFVGAWLPIDEDQQSFLGFRNSILGMDTYLGRSYWSLNHNFIVHLGPLTSGNFYNFLPTGKHYEELNNIIKMYASPELSFQIRISLSEKEQLNSTFLQPQSVQLGWASFLEHKPNAYNVTVVAA
jgi:type VI secretion system protein ImpH